MAITAQAIKVLASPGSPTALTPAGAFAFSFGDVQEPAVVGTVTFTGDGATTAAVVNWIDGTQTIPFTPSHVEALLVNGSAAGTDTVGVLRAEGSASSPRVSSITNVSATINYSSFVGNATTSVVLLKLYK